MGLAWAMRSGLYHGRNSGFGALQLAVCLGANPIYLLGFDMTLGKGGKSHFHSGYAMGLKAPKLQAYAENFARVAPLIKERGIEVVNLSPSSALECFPKVQAAEVLA